MKGGGRRYLTSACSITGVFVGVVETGADFVDLEMDLDLDFVLDLLGAEDREGVGDSSLEGLL